MFCISPRTSRDTGASQNQRVGLGTFFCADVVRPVFLMQRVLWTLYAHALIYSRWISAPPLNICKAMDNLGYEDIELQEYPVGVPLPYGKEYHIFLSYSSLDREYAFELIDSLQNRFGLKCLTYEDTPAGGQVITNVINGMEKSMKIVYLVSNSFKESIMCQMEVANGIFAAHSSAQNCIIPVLLDAPMPRELQTFNYIDARNKNLCVVEKIFHAFKYGASQNCILPNVLLPFDDCCNGSVLQTISGTVKNCLFEKLEFKNEENLFIDVKDEERLEKINRISQEVVTLLNSCKYCTKFYLKSIRFWIIFSILLYISAVGVFLLFFMLYLSTKDPIPRDSIGTVYAVFLPVMILVPSPVLYFASLYRITLHVKAFNVLHKIIRKTYSDTKVLPLLRNAQTIVILHYDTDPCKDFISHVLKQKYPHKSEDEIQGKAEDLLLDKIFEMHHSIAEWKLLPLFTYNRHNTFMQRKCLCQLIEPDIINLHT
ncbi:uncharacterized protein LOC134277324 [Saccostrea cucullata]|uniref:uncharacterized protein LOC134277324 n=1 Tax=Saccostrea cuccullata TaxID=36930 RepID=UPI002ED44BB6